MDEELDENLSLPEQIEILMEDLPVPVQNFLRSPERDRISLELSKKYGLHADAAGVFERSYLYMLLGVFTPDEFVQELRESGLGEEVVRGLASDVNELVFKKLRAEEQAPPFSIPPQPEPLRQPTTPPMVPVMRVGAAPTATPSQPPTAPMGEIRTMTRDMEHAAATPAQAPAMPPPSIPLSAEPAAPVMPVAPAVPTAPQQIVPAETAVPTEPATIPPAPPTLPTSPTPAAATPPIAPAAPTAPAPVRLTPVNQGHASAPIRKEYGSDPYREPIE